MYEQEKLYCLELVALKFWLIFRLSFPNIEIWRKVIKKIQK